MKYRGYLIKQSLLDPSILEELKITETETFPCPEHMKADYIADIWTGIVFEVAASEADNIAERLSKVIKPRGCYLDLHTEKDNYLVFHNKVVKYPRLGERQPWPEEAITAARKAEIPPFMKKEAVLTECGEEI
jgi:hypothetical protein